MKQDSRQNKYWNILHRINSGFEAGMVTQEKRLEGNQAKIVSHFVIASKESRCLFAVQTVLL